ncbi:hypothetical protein [Burkholderia stagnalis]|uniref:hypothetical protein n=1 Tax=Burkholderia stagnalis TaxID=1503054 RepID=UPI0012DAC055|nr:hypothetical protein [Burkholderia stagnalis]
MISMRNRAISPQCNIAFVAGENPEKMHVRTYGIAPMACAVRPFRTAPKRLAAQGRIIAAMRHAREMHFIFDESNSRAFYSGMFRKSSDRSRARCDPVHFRHTYLLAVKPVHRLHRKTCRTAARMNHLLHSNLRSGTLS